MFSKLLISALVASSAAATELPAKLQDFNPAASSHDFVFDVAARPKEQGEGGIIQARSATNTPALVGQGMAVTLFTLAPGGENLPHYHPRATELVYMLKGEMEVGFTGTDGKAIINTVKAGQSALFPRALIHFQRNTGHVEAQFVSMLNSENPGVASLPRVFAALPVTALSNALRAPAAEIKQLRGRVLPPSLLRGNAKYDGAAGESGAAPVPAFHGKKKKKSNKKCECAGVRHATWGGSKCGDGDYHGRSWCYVAPGACADGTAHSSKLAGYEWSYSVCDSSSNSHHQYKGGEW